MIDLHTHILPRVDDGAESLETALAMAHMAAEHGTEYLVVTPHVNIPGTNGNYWDKDMQRRYAAFRNAVREAGIPLGIGYGAEVFYTDDVPALLADGKLLPLAGSRCLLMEFPFDIDPITVRNALSAVNAAGFVPIMAHPERYRMTAYDPRAIYDWVQSGCIMQMNKDSLLGGFGATVFDTARTLLQHGLVHCIASDAHSPAHRDPCLHEIRDYLTAVSGARDAEILLRENPRRILKGLPPLSQKLVPF